MRLCDIHHKCQDLIFIIYSKVTFISVASYMKVLGGNLTESHDVVFGIMPRQLYYW